MRRALIVLTIVLTLPIVGVAFGLMGAGIAIAGMLKCALDLMLGDT